MLTTEQNDRLARVGPGTPGGELMRRYWVPFLPSAKLDEDPVQPVRLLGENLTCYRDKSGNIGLIGSDACTAQSTCDGASRTRTACAVRITDGCTEPTARAWKRPWKHGPTCSRID